MTTLAILVFYNLLFGLLLYIFFRKEQRDAREIERLHIQFTEEFVKTGKLESFVEQLQEMLASKDSELQSARGSKKSTEVRTGQLVEAWAPFLNEFEYDKKNAHFLGNPIDYVIFDKKEGVVDSIVFLEIKTGGSKLSKVQREIKKAISQGKVKFEEMKIK